MATYIWMAIVMLVMALFIIAAFVGYSRELKEENSQNQ